MDVILGHIRERHVDHVRQALDVHTSRRHVGADQEPNIPVFKRRKISLFCMGGGVFRRVEQRVGTLDKQYLKYFVPHRPSSSAYGCHMHVPFHTHLCPWAADADSVNLGGLNKIGQDVLALEGFRKAVCLTGGVQHLCTTKVTGMSIAHETKRNAPLPNLPFRTHPSFLHGPHPRQNAARKGILTAALLVAGKAFPAASLR